MQLEIKKFLFDIKVASDSIAEYLLLAENVEAYSGNKMLRRAVEREMEIIGEALNRILKINPEISITNSRRIVDFRNWISHGYDKIDDNVVWLILHEDMIVLKKEVEHLLID